MRAAFAIVRGLITKVPDVTVIDYSKVIFDVLVAHRVLLVELKCVEVDFSSFQGLVTWTYI